MPNPVGGKHPMDHVNGTGIKKMWMDRQAAPADATATNTLNNYKQQDALNAAQTQFTKDSTEMEAAGKHYGSDWGNALPIPSQIVRDKLE